MAGDYGTLTSLADQDNQVKQVLSLVPTLDPKMHVLLNMLDTGEPITGIGGRVNWQEKNVHNRAGTIDEALDNSETDVDVTSGEGVHLGLGDIILIDSEYMQVTAVATDTLTVRRGVWGSSAVTHDTATAWTKVSSGVDENVTIAARGYVDITEYFNLPQQMLYTYEETYLSKNLARYGGSAKITDMVTDALISVRTDLNQALYKGVRATFADGTTSGMLGGMTTFVPQGNSGSDFVSDSLTEKIINNSFEDIIGTSSDKRLPTHIFCTYPMKQAIAHLYRALNAYNRDADENAAGMRIETIVTPYGNIEIVADAHCQTGRLYFLRLTDIKVNAVRGMEWQREEKPIQKLATQINVYGAYSLTVQRPKSMIYQAGLSEAYT